MYIWVFSSSGGFFGSRGLVEGLCEGRLLVPVFARGRYLPSFDVVAPDFPATRPGTSGFVPGKKEAQPQKSSFSHGKEEAVG